eukprot:546690-Prorocentrum_minimum.AAC.2
MSFGRGSQELGSHSAGVHKSWDLIRRVGRGSQELGSHWAGAHIDSTRGRGGGRRRVCETLTCGHSGGLQRRRPLTRRQRQQISQTPDLAADELLGDVLVDVRQLQEGGGARVPRGALLGRLPCGEGHRLRDALAHL